MRPTFCDRHDCERASIQTRGCTTMHTHIWATAVMNQTKTYRHTTSPTPHCRLGTSPRATDWWLEHFSEIWWNDLSHRIMYSHVRTVLIKINSVTSKVVENIQNKQNNNYLIPKCRFKAIIRVSRPMLRHQVLVCFFFSFFFLVCGELVAESIPAFFTNLILFLLYHSYFHTFFLPYILESRYLLLFFPPVLLASNHKVENSLSLSVCVFSPPTMIISFLKTHKLVALWPWVFYKHLSSSSTGFFPWVSCPLCALISFQWLTCSVTTLRVRWVATQSSFKLMQRQFRSRNAKGSS